MEQDASASRRLHVLTRILQPTCKQTHVGLHASSATPLVSEHGVDVAPPPSGLKDEYNTLLTPDALQFLADLTRTFDTAVDKLHLLRLRRKCDVKDGGQLPVIGPDVGGSWQVAALPHRLTNRHLDLGDVSPANTSHFTHALSADVQGIQVDFDDGHCPTWRNQLTGLHNVYLSVNSRLPGAPHISKAPVLMMRPRAWNMTEHNVMVNGKAVPGSLFDFALLMVHNARTLAAHESGPYFYLSKVESSYEAHLWARIFVWSERRLGLDHGAIRACVLIENIFSAFELDHILYALRDHSLGLNCGIWDYAASVIAKFGERREFVLPDRNKYVNMERHFLKSYLQLVVRACHRRGAHATGGMAALLVPQDKKEAEAVIAKVCSAKLAEIKEGVDGFMVYDLQLVPHINKLWQQNAPGQNQLRTSHADLTITAQDLLLMPTGGVTYAGLRHNIAVAVLFIRHWLDGVGHFSHLGAIEDSATAEISRSQIWQWIRHQTPMEDHPDTVTRQLVQRLANEFVSNHRSTLIGGKLNTAKQIFMEIVTKRDFPDFITTYLNDSHIFTSSQK